MEDMFQPGDNTMQPTTRTYNAIINALSSTRARENAEKAEKVLSNMEKLNIAGDYNIAPDVYTY